MPGVTGPVSRRVRSAGTPTEERLVDLDAFVTEHGARGTGCKSWPACRRRVERGGGRRTRRPVPPDWATHLSVVRSRSGDPDPGGVAFATGAAGTGGGQPFGRLLRGGRAAILHGLVSGRGLSGRRLVSPASRVRFWASPQLLGWLGRHRPVDLGRPVQPGRDRQPCPQRLRGVHYSEFAPENFALTRVAPTTHLVSAICLGRRGACAANGLPALRKRGQPRVGGRGDGWQWTRRRLLWTDHRAWPVGADLCVHRGWTRAAGRLGVDRSRAAANPHSGAGSGRPVGDRGRVGTRGAPVRQCGMVEAFVTPHRSRSRGSSSSGLRYGSLFCPMWSLPAELPCAAGTAATWRPSSAKPRGAHRLILTAGRPP